VPSAVVSPKLVVDLQREVDEVPPFLDALVDDAR